MSRGWSRKLMTFGELTSGKSLDFQIQELLNFRYGPWGGYKSVGEIHMNNERVGEERGGKEMDGCPLTHTTNLVIGINCLQCDSDEG
jgi:hypothetical protein